MRFPLAAALALSLLRAQPDTSSPDRLLAGIRRHVRDNLARLPNYTCRLTIERFHGPAAARHPTRVDTVHIEVGYVDGKELYAWPGQKFENKRLEQLMPPGGAVGNGDFALHIRSIFLTNAATFTYVGPTEEDGRPALQFQYRIAQEKSQYALSDGEHTALIGYHGSFWADAKTLGLMRLEVMVDDIPERIRVRQAGSKLTYALTRIGGADFLLPQSSDLFMLDSAGRESRNLTRFEQCHQYQGESVVSFVDPSAVAESPKAVTEVTLPAGLLVEMSLRTELNLERLVIGDPVKATVVHDVQKTGVVIIPKGATVTGRVTRLGHMTNGRVQYTVAGIRLSTIEFADKHAGFTASLESFAFAAAQIAVAAGQDRSVTKRERRDGYPLEPGEGLLSIRGNVSRIPPGAHMFWRTLPGRKD